MTQSGLSVLKVAVPIDMTVRDSRPEDIAEIHRIYAASVMHGTGSFEETPPSAAEMVARRQAILDRGLPYLVAEFRGGVVGYAYAGPFRPRSAYRYTLEDSVYVAPELRGLAVGRTLLAALIDRCIALGYRRMIAVIGDSENHASIRAHEANGFIHAGTLVHVGLKFGRWLDSVYMQRPLADEAGRDPQD
ncbi:N-acetyltransferase family protein [Oleispirillum naphthae]|uniref:GNAT family N-acetyltransferase n=1 Tax=Oleispirillum naphthae TaxID=2838853 RepID=UPI00308254EA